MKRNCAEAPSMVIPSTVLDLVVVKAKCQLSMNRGKSLKRKKGNTIAPSLFTYHQCPSDWMHAEVRCDWRINCKHSPLNFFLLHFSLMMGALSDQKLFKENTPSFKYTLPQKSSYKYKFVVNTNKVQSFIIKFRILKLCKKKF